MGYSVVTTIDGWAVRYTEWVTYDKKSHSGDWADSHGVELYNHTGDPDENANQAGSAVYKVAQAALSAKLHAGWRAVPQ